MHYLIIRIINYYNNIMLTPEKKLKIAKKELAKAIKRCEKEKKRLNMEIELATQELRLATGEIIDIEKKNSFSDLYKN